MQRAWVPLLLVLCALAPRFARAQASIDAAPPPVLDAGAPAPDAGPVITPPTLVHDSPAAFPQDATDAGLAGDVELRLTIDVDGSVARAELVKPVAPPLDEAALHASMSLQFTPALVNGVPTPATIGYVYRFLPPPPPPPQATARLEGVLELRGRNGRAAGASVTARRPDAKEAAHSTTSDPSGAFALDLEPGAWVVNVSAANLEKFEKTEQLAPNQKVDVRYLVTPVHGAYETVILGERERVEVSRTDLRGEELREVPGTMGGDPFRAVLSLPGVAEPVSGVAYPIVRGAAPASTGWFLDGVRLPNLFHFFLLSAVVHPEFIEGIDFYPSAYPAEFGRFTGGIASAHTATGRTDRAHGEVSVDLINAGAFVETPLHLKDETVSLAFGGRFSYLGVGLKVAEWLNLVDPGGYADYWDYQARAEWRPSGSRGTFRLFAFGSHDEAGSTDQTTNQRQSAGDSTFHRLDLRWRGPLGRAEAEFGGALGIDQLIGGDAIEGDTWLFAPRASARWKLGASSLRVGGDGELKSAKVFQRSGNGLDSTSGNHAGAFGALNETLTGFFGGVFVEGELALGRFLLVPGLRAELYTSDNTTLPALEPRLAVRYQVSDSTTLKLGGGLYHQPPTAYVELPTIDLLGLASGLQTSLNGAAGVEHQFDALGLDLDASVYWSEKLVLRELEIDDPDAYTLRNSGNSAQANALDPWRERRGRSIGLELMLRRRLSTNLFGWIAYTLSHTTRWDPQFETVYPDLFDQQHILNLVLSYQLPRRWRIGVGLHAHSGKPYDPYHLKHINGIVEFQPPNSRCGPVTNAGMDCWVADPPRSDRLPGFYRIDARIEKSWIYDRYTLTAYLDVLNASARQEVLARDYTFDYDQNENATPVVRDQSLPLVVPMIGVRGDF